MIHETATGKLRAEAMRRHASDDAHHAQRARERREQRINALVAQVRDNVAFADHETCKAVSTLTISVDAAAGDEERDWPHELAKALAAMGQSRAVVTLADGTRFRVTCEEVRDGYKLLVNGDTNEAISLRVAEEILHRLHRWRDARNPGPFLVDAEVDAPGISKFIQAAITARTADLDSQAAALRAALERVTEEFSADRKDAEVFWRARGGGTVPPEIAAILERHDSALAQARAALAGGDGWIPVSERLPPERELLLAVGGTTVRTAHLRGTCWLMFPGGWAMKPQPTHWRPLPALPAAKEAT